MVRQKSIMTEARFMTKAAAGPLPDLWNDAHAADLDEPGLLLYRSNLLGSDLRITNFGGGNTSAKLTMTDPLTQEPITVLWVKGSGDRKSTRLNSSHLGISYAVFCLKKKKEKVDCALSSS